MQNKNASDFFSSILFTHGRFKTMSNMILDDDFKLELAKTGLFMQNEFVKCIGCNIIMKKINAKLVKRHKFSENCISAINSLRCNEAVRKKSFVSFKTCRRRFRSQHIICKLAKCGFYSFGKTTYVKCSCCHVIFKFNTIEHAQKQHHSKCVFVEIDDLQEQDNDSFNLENAKEQVMNQDFRPPLTFMQPSAPFAEEIAATTTIHLSETSECKICFEEEKSVCFLPCRHLAACVKCSRRCKKCCVCNSVIKRRIETLPQ